MAIIAILLASHLGPSPVTMIPNNIPARLGSWMNGLPILSVTPALSCQASTPIKFSSRRPVPARVGITVYAGNLSGSGTLGPAIVWGRPDVGSCCQILPATAGHVAKPNFGDPNPPSGARAGYQPYRSSGSPAINRIGYIAKTFRLRSCGQVIIVNGQKRVPPSCTSRSAWVNNTTINPDLAAINRSFYRSPFNNPMYLDPTLRLQKSRTEYLNGPSGKAPTPGRGHRHRIWGPAHLQIALEERRTFVGPKCTRREMMSIRGGT